MLTSAQSSSSRGAPRKLGLPIAMVAAAVLLLVAWLGRNASSSSTVQVAATPAAEPSAEKDQAIDALKQQVAALERRLDDTAAKPAADAPVSTRIPAAQSTPELRALREARMVEYERDVGARAATEPADAAWTGEVTASVQERNGATDTPVQIESVRCGATLCTVVMTHEDSGAHASLYQSLMNPADLAPGFGGPAMMRRHPRPEGGYRSTMFFAKPGGHMPDLDLTSVPVNEAPTPR